ncbi:MULTISPECIES: hypothetical protein [unclassified Streptomyces]|uniref:hypothetical protein n=1 Tax=unclassified Streptomyces TaxID=2593676 RepID=UPI00226EFA96|nr:MULTISPECIES: hypothetical protein [unclassified Streptomyces]MCY0919590.1 hypothetical protein [Streptomyces sp. H27-G5]MCY0959658.1 hypothetical protein [Streptomyces sp. H27-H5]
MEVRENPPGDTFNHVRHPLLRQQVRDRQTDRTGVLMAVVRESVGTVAGRTTHTRTAFIRDASGLEFTAPPDALEAVAPAAAGQPCARCGAPIRAGGQSVIQTSTDGRPAAWAHDVRDSACRPR